jgi:hypothetical protein
MSCIGAVVRIPLGVILGFIVMMGVLFAGLSAVMIFAGTPFCFADDSLGGSAVRSWVASEKFCAAILGVMAVGAFFGGFAAMRIGGTAAIVFLTLLFGALGTLTAMGKLQEPDAIRFKDRPAERPEHLGPMQAAQWSETPDWCEWGKTGAGLAGIAIGAAVGKGPPRAAKRLKPKD